MPELAEVEAEMERLVADRDALLVAGHKLHGRLLDKLDAGDDDLLAEWEEAAGVTAPKVPGLRPFENGLA